MGADILNQAFANNILLLIILALSVIGKNDMLSISVAFLLFISLLGQVGGGFESVSRTILTWSDEYGLKIGVTILMIGVLAPLALGKIKLEDMLALSKSKEGIIAILAGVVVAVFAAKGGNLLESDPQIVFSLVFGTIIGIVIFKGYPVGPLVASGIAAVALQIIGLFK